MDNWMANSSLMGSSCLPGVYSLAKYDLDIRAVIQRRPQ